MRTRSIRAPALISYAFLAVVLTALVFPTVWTLLTSFKPRSEVLSVTLEANWTIDNYVGLLSGTSQGFGARGGFQFLHYASNSAIVALASSLIVLLLAVPLSYLVVRMRRRVRILEVLVAVLIGFQLLPSMTALVPFYLMLDTLKLVNTHLGLIIARVGSYLPFMTLLMVPYMQEVPTELEDAALIDGCDRLQVLWHVVLPLARSGLAVVATLTAIFSLERPLVQHDPWQPRGCADAAGGHLAACRRA